MKATKFLLLFFFVSLYANAQKYKFGKVSKSELSEKVCPIDSTANACVLYKEQKTYFDYVSGQGFLVREENFVRIKIYNKEGFEYATAEIPSYHTASNHEKIKNLKGVTYNLVNNKIVKTKLNKKNVYLEKTTEHKDLKKFTMPNLKPGSVVEWKYTLLSPFISKLNDAVLQYDIPAKKIAVTTYMPEFFKYRTYQKGFIPINVKTYYNPNSITITQKERSGGKGWSTIETNFSQHSFDYNDLVQEINMTGVPALKDESYAGNINNYRAAIVYELVSIKFPNAVRKDYALTWEDVAKETYASSKFGSQLKKRKYFKKDIEALVPMPNDYNKLKAVFELAKQKIKWNNKYDYFVDKGVAKAYREGSGNVADVNLNLINMLNAAGLSAKPVLVSTVKHGIPLFATRTGFNYVIAAVDLNGKRYLLDATDPISLPELLPERALNFQGRLITKEGKTEIVPLFTKDYSSKHTTLNLKFEEGELSGIATSIMDNYYAYHYRNDIEDKNSSEAINKWLQDKYENIDVLKGRVRNTHKIYKKLNEALQFETDEYVDEVSDKILISPLLEWAFETSNPFKSKEREFPIFFNYPRIRSVNVTLNIPENYEIVSLPKSGSFSFGNNDGTYDYNITQNGQTIQLKSTYVINSPIVTKEYYQQLKEFIDKVIQKQQEKIVLKKK